MRFEETLRECLLPGGTHKVMLNKRYATHNNRTMWVVYCNVPETTPEEKIKRGDTLKITTHICRSFENANSFYAQKAGVNQ